MISIDDWHKSLSIETINDSVNTTQNPDTTNLSKREENNSITKSSVDDVVSSCLSSVQHLEDMKFNLSNIKTDGEEFVKIELLIPRKSFAEGSQGSNKCGKNDVEKIVINTSNSLPKSQIVNSLEQCVDQNSTSKRISSHDLRKSNRKNVHCLKPYVT